MAQFKKNLMLVALKKNLNGSQFYKDLFGYFNNARWMSGGKVVLSINYSNKKHNNEKHVKINNLYRAEESK